MIAGCCLTGQVYKEIFSISVESHALQRGDGLPGISQCHSGTTLRELKTVVYTLHLSHTFFGLEVFTENALHFLFGFGQ